MLLRARVLPIASGVLNFVLGGGPASGMDDASPAANLNAGASNGSSAAMSMERARAVLSGTSKSEGRKVTEFFKAMNATQKAEYDARQADKAAADKRQREERMQQQLASKRGPGRPITRPLVKAPEQFEIEMRELRDQHRTQQQAAAGLDSGVDLEGSNPEGSVQVGTGDLCGSVEGGDGRGGLEVAAGGHTAEEGSTKEDTNSSDAPASDDGCDADDENVGESKTVRRRHTWSSYDKLLVVLAWMTDTKLGWSELARRMKESMFKERFVGENWELSEKNVRDWVKAEAARQERVRAALKEQSGVAEPSKCIKQGRYLSKECAQELTRVLLGQCDGNNILQNSTTLRPLVIAVLQKFPEVVSNARVPWGWHWCASAVVLKPVQLIEHMRIQNAIDHKQSRMHVPGPAPYESQATERNKISFLCLMQKHQMKEYGGRFAVSRSWINKACLDIGEWPYNL
jgi:hypothetical protein